MSHHTHVFLSNECTAKACCSFIDSQLSDYMLYSCGIDGCLVLGAINLETDKYTSVDRHHFIDPAFTTVKGLEAWANGLFSIKQWNFLESELKKHIENQNFFLAARTCEQMDGMQEAVRDGSKWTAKEPFTINDNYLNLPGITDWTGIYDTACNEGKEYPIFAVIVDFHS